MVEPIWYRLVGTTRRGYRCRLTGPAFAGVKINQRDSSGMTLIIEYPQNINKFDLGPLDTLKMGHRPITVDHLLGLARPAVELTIGWLIVLFPYTAMPSPRPISLVWVTWQGDILDGS